MGFRSFVESVGEGAIHERAQRQINTFGTIDSHDEAVYAAEASIASGNAYGEGLRRLGRRAMATAAGAVALGVLFMGAKSSGAEAMPAPLHEGVVPAVAEFTPSPDQFTLPQ